MLPFFILLGLIVVVVAWVVGIYNGLVGLRNQVKEAWAQVDVQLKRRFDLIPNLMETVKGYMTHERETLEAVTQARAAVAGAGGLPERMQAEAGLTAALGRLFAVAESYPDLKASTNFLALQEELTSTENKISFARQFYNETVMNMNNKVQMFPSNIIAGMFNFKARDLLRGRGRGPARSPQGGLQLTCGNRSQPTGASPSSWCSPWPCCWRPWAGSGGEYFMGEGGGPTGAGHRPGRLVRHDPGRLVPGRQRHAVDGRAPSKVEKEDLPILFNVVEEMTLAVGPAQDAGGLRHRRPGAQRLRHRPPARDRLGGRDQRPAASASTATNCRA